MQPGPRTVLLGDDLRQNPLAGTRLALFLPVRALDFRISIGQYVALVLTSLAFWLAGGMLRAGFPGTVDFGALTTGRSEEHTSELQSPCNLVCRILLVKK